MSTVYRNTESYHPFQGKKPCCLAKEEILCEVSANSFLIKSSQNPTPWLVFLFELKGGILSDKAEAKKIIK